MKVLVAIPAYDRKICVETARALLDEQSAALILDIQIEVAFIPGCSLITMARNQAVRTFLKGDADRLVFVDADVSWEVGSLLRIASHEADFVGGAYRYKDENEGYPVSWLPGELWAGADGLLEVDAVPGGFLSLSRAVFERLDEAFPGRCYTHMDEEFTAYFHAPFKDGRMYGEDTAFCHDYRACGGRVWLDPELSLTHVDGGRKYPGHIGNWLRNRI